MIAHEKYLVGPEMMGAIAGVHAAATRFGLPISNDAAVTLAVYAISHFALAGGMERASRQHIRQLIADMRREGAA